MNKVLYIILISLFSITVISCSSSDDAATTASDNTDTTSDNTTTTSDDDTTSDNITTTSDNTTTTTDTTAPVITEVTAVTTPTSDTTPDYTFSSTEAGTNSYGGSCSSENTSTTADNNTITFNALPDGTYSDCKISVTDNANNTSDNLSVSTFTIDTVVPTVGGLEINSASGVQNSLLNAGDNVSVAVTFSDNVSVTGIPQLTLVVGSTNRTATYASGNGSNPLLFQYTIQVGETDTDGISIGVNSLTLNSGTIRDVAGNNATITHSAVSANSSYKVDTTEPTLSETTLVPSLTNDNSTQYTFSSSKGGTISIGGSCSSDNSTAVADNMTVSFADLQDGTYSNCTITVTDSAGNSDTIAVNSFTIDTTAPTLSQVTAVSSPTNDNTSSYTFSTTEAGNITYGVCSGSPDNASVDNNTITFDTLGDGSYNDCKISVTDNANNTSDNLSVNSFTIDTVKPILAQVTAVTTPTKDPTPGYAFSSDEAGTISYGGSSCSSGGTSAINGTNSISFGTLSEASYTCTITVTDSAGNASSALSVNTFVIDTTAPTVSSVSSSTSDGTYRTDDNITLIVTFSEQVTVDNSSGNPIIQLETGSTDSNAIYSSGSGTDNLSLIYTVVISDNSTDLEYKASNSLELNSGTIRDSALNDAVLTLPNIGSSNSLSLNKSIVIDTTSIFGTSKYNKSIFGP